jgi:hypothetical protein
MSDGTTSAKIEDSVANRVRFSANKIPSAHNPVVIVAKLNWEAWASKSTN